MKEEKIHSQNGEDGIIRSILEEVYPPSYYGRFVEIGAGADENNTLALEKRGWTGIRLDANDGVWVTPENAPRLLVERYMPPGTYQFLSIDIDGMDYWVWKALLEAGHDPWLVCIEYNASLGASLSLTIPEDPDFCWERTEHFGASLMALAKLGARYGYVLRYCESNGVNAFFERRGGALSALAIEFAVKVKYKPRLFKFAPTRGPWQEV